ncbi:MAG TPA: FKBP-type peptidyl-prolyl cis-trans isomerase [Gammaproteobacteria bacterium]|nr:FKBP-type peptidyl-prolyl cis-trans isomerase [Gammaproteobacteria bacterium]
MARQIDKGVELIDEIEGTGTPAAKGCRVKYCARMYLHKGDEITPDFEMISNYREHLNTTILEGVELVEHTLELGKRRAIAGVEKSLLGMKKGGYREILVSPHLAYREEGIPGRIPENALLRIKLWVKDVQDTTRHVVEPDV